MTFLPLLGVGALLLASTPALAQRPEIVTARVTVRHADLDLSTRGGLATLDRRVARAARQACGSASSYDLAGKVRLRRCREDARASGMAQRDRLAAAARPLEVAAGR